MKLELRARIFTLLPVLEVFDVRVPSFDNEVSNSARLAILPQIKEFDIVLDVAFETFEFFSGPELGCAPQILYCELRCALQTPHPSQTQTQFRVIGVAEESLLQGSLNLDQGVPRLRVEFQCEAAGVYGGVEIPTFQQCPSVAAISPW